jgi:hypothetical protein
MLSGQKNSAIQFLLVTFVDFLLGFVVHALQSFMEEKRAGFSFLFPLWFGRKTKEERSSIFLIGEV